MFYFLFIFKGKSPWLRAFTEFLFAQGQANLTAAREARKRVRGPPEEGSGEFCLFETRCSSVMSVFFEGGVACGGLILELQEEGERLVARLTIGFEEKLNLGLPRD